MTSRVGRRRSVPRLEALEPRLLYSADAAAVMPIPAASAAATAALTAEVAAAAAQPQADAQAHAAPHELVVIDARVPDAGELLADLQAQQAAGRRIDLLVLDADVDGIDAIADALAQARAPYDAMHLIAHGADGRVALGGATLDTATLRSRAGEIAGWSSGLAERADLLLYGCDVADDAAGRGFVDALASLTGADVAASTDASGSALLGGDWDLEYDTGAIEASLAPSIDEQQRYDGLLAINLANPGVDAIVNTTTGGTQSLTSGSAGRQVAVNTAGRTVVVWEDGSSNKVKARVFDVNGVAQTGEITVSSSGGAQAEPAVAIDASGRFVVVWTEAGGTDGSGKGVFGRVFNADGTVATSRFQVNSVGANDETTASVAIDPLGNATRSFAVTWNQDRGGSFGKDVMVRDFGWDGTPVSGSEAVVNSTTAGAQTASAIAFAGNGTALVVWQSAGQDGSGSGIYGQRYASGGAALGGEFRVNTAVANDQTAPDVGGDAAGDFVVAWVSDLGGSGKTDVLAQRIDSAGALQGGEIVVTQATDKDQSDPAIQVGTSGHFVVAWQSQKQDQGSTWGIFAREFAADGTALSGEVPINGTTDGNQVAPSLAVSGTAGVVVWSGRSDSSTPTDSAGVFMQRVSFSATDSPLNVTVSGTATGESGGALVLTVRLGQPPAGNVSIALALTDTMEATLSAATLVFTPANWSTSQSVVVTGRDDTLVDGDVSYQVRVTASSTDAVYDGLVELSPLLANVDDDTYNTVVVTTSSDTADGDTSSLAALMADRGSDGKISLREALLASNATANGPGGADRIAFDLSAAGSRKITLSTALPDITDAVVIDATTDPGYAGSPQVSLAANPFSLGMLAVDGLTLKPGSDGSTIRGLSIQSFFGAGIQVESSANTIERNYLGIDPDGSTDRGNWSDGIRLTSGTSANLVRNNVISGSQLAAGIKVDGAVGASITGNLVGTDASGTLGIGNGVYGIDIENGATGIQISGNVISDNGDAGIYLNDTRGVVIADNDIGTDASGSRDLHNLGPGIALDNGAAANTIGGTQAGDGNRILFNHGQAVLVRGSTSIGNAILGNRIGDNDFGIDLLAAGASYTTTGTATPNDAGDGDAGGNALQNTPALLSAIPGTGTLSVSGTLNSAASTWYRIEVFTVATPDASGHGQGTSRIGAFDVLTDASGNASFTQTLSAAPAAGTRVTATATRSDAAHTAFYETSEFAANVFVNTPPAITSGATMTRQENGTAVATLTASDADAAQALSWSIVGGTDAGRFTIGAATGALAFVAAPDFEVAGDANGDNVYQVTVQVNDPLGGIAQQALTITVTNVNEAPTMTSPLAFSRTENVAAVATLTATDPDAAATLTWSITGGTDAARFAIDAATGALSFAVAPNFEAAADANADNVYAVTVQVRDQGGLTASQSIAVTVTNRNESPTIASPAAFSRSEGATAVATLTATDPDTAQTLSWSIAGGADAARFAIDALTGALSFVVAPDFQLPADANADNVYDLSVRVADSGGLSVTQAIAVTVTNVNAAPSITSGTSFTRAENGTAVATLSAGDPDGPGDVLSWSITGGADRTRFAVDAATGALSFVTAPNFEAPADANADNVYEVTVQVSDPGGLSDAKTLSVTVTNVNEAPTITSTGAFGRAENGAAVGTLAASDPDAGSTLTWAIAGGADAARFTIDAATGALSFVTAPDFEAPQDAGADNVYDLTVRVADQGGLSATQAVAVTVSNVNEAPAITSSASFTRSEGPTSVATLTATDPDAAQALAWSIVGGADAARFAIDAATGALSFLASPDYQAPTDANADNVYELQVRVQDPGGLAATQALTVAVTNVNDTPVITSAASFTRGENATAVERLSATDVDAGDTLRWSIAGGTDAGRFTIDPLTGALAFASTPDFEAPTDANADNVYELNVAVTDAGGLMAGQAVAVTVSDLNEAPVITSALAFSQPENTGAVTVLTASDPDRTPQVLRWTIVGGADSARFTLDPVSGALAFVAAPDFEIPADADGNGVYALDLQLADAGGLLAQASLTLAVTDVAEAPALRLPGALATDANASLALSAAQGNDIGLTDPDLVQGPLTVTLTAQHGLLNIGQTAGLTGLQGDPQGSATLAFTGALADLQAALGSLRFSPSATYSGPATIDVVARDAAQSSLADSGQVAITVRALGAASTAPLASLSLAPGSTTTLSLAQLLPAGVDASSGTLVWTVAQNGSLGQLLRDGVPLSAGDRFTQADVQAGRIAYAADATSAGTDSVTLSVTDVASSGRASPLVLSAQIGIAVGGTQSSTLSQPSSTTDTAVTRDGSASAVSAAGGGAITAGGTAGVAPPSDGKIVGSRAGAAAGSGAAAGEVVAPLRVQSLRAPGVANDAGGGAAGVSTAADADRIVFGERSRGQDLLQRMGFELALRRESAGSAELPRATPAVIARVVHDAGFMKSIDRVRDDVQQRLTLDRDVAASSAAVGASLSVGYAVWLLRGGVLLSSLLATMPATLSLDPLPVLTRGRAGRNPDGEDDSLQGMLRKAQGPQPDRAPPPGKSATQSGGGLPDLPAGAVLPESPPSGRPPAQPSTGSSTSGQT